jgi:hypothetical protein
MWPFERGSAARAAPRPQDIGVEETGRRERDLAKASAWVARWEKVCAKHAASGNRAALKQAREQLRWWREMERLAKQRGGA